MKISSDIKKGILVLCSFYVTACTQAPEPIYLVCDGYQTSNVQKDKKQNAPEHRHVQRSFSFHNDNRIVEEGVIDFNQKELKKDLKSSKKLVWIFQVDNGPDLFETDLTKIYATPQEESFSTTKSSVLIGNTELFAHEKNRTKYRNGSKYTYDYSVTINRVTGAFRETLKILEDDPAVTIMTDEAVGTCTKVDKKF